MVFWLVLGTATMLVAALVRARANRLLTADQANKVATVFAMRRLVRVFGQLYFLSLLALWFAFPVSIPSWSGQAALVLGLVALIWSHASLIRRFRSLGLPAAYIAQFNRARFILYSGLPLAALPAIYVAIRA